MMDGTGGQSRLQMILMWAVAIPVLAFLLGAVLPTILAGRPGG